LGKLWDNMKKVWNFLYDLVNNPIGYFVIASLVAAGILPNAVTSLLPKKPVPEIAAPKDAVPSEVAPPEAPKQLTPVGKPKPDCISSTLATIREALADSTTAQAVYRRSYGGRSHCGWYLTVAAEPTVHANGMWRVHFSTRDGVKVVAELRTAPALREGDIVQVGGVIADYRLGGDAPMLLLQRAWISKR
jgi:hypothetical protein